MFTASYHLFAADGAQKARRIRRAALWLSPYADAGANILAQVG